MGRLATDRDPNADGLQFSGLLPVLEAASVVPLTLLTRVRDLVSSSDLSSIAGCTNGLQAVLTIIVSYSELMATHEPEHGVFSKERPAQEQGRAAMPQRRSSSP